MVTFGGSADFANNHLVEIRDMVIRRGPFRGETGFGMRIDEFHIAPHQTVFVRGSTGSGKTLLLKTLLMQRLPHEVKSFEISLNDFGMVDLADEIAHKNLRRLRAISQRVFISNLLPDRPAPTLLTRDYLLQVGEKTTMLHSKYAGLIAKNSEALRADKLLDRRLSSLSSGQKRLVGLVKAMSVEVPIVLLDEPFFLPLQIKRRLPDLLRNRPCSIVLTGTDDVSVNLPNIKSWDLVQCSRSGVFSLKH